MEQKLWDSFVGDFAWISAKLGRGRSRHAAIRQEEKVLASGFSVGGSVGALHFFPFPWAQDFVFLSTRFLVFRSSSVFLIRARSGQSKALGQLEDVQRSNATPIQSRFLSYPSFLSFTVSVKWAAFQITCGANRKTPKFW